MPRALLSAQQRSSLLVLLSQQQPALPSLRVTSTELLLLLLWLQILPAAEQKLPAVVEAETNG
jgi:hypothetical protein